jgi:hypothetical protein
MIVKNLLAAASDPIGKIDASGVPLWGIKAVTDTGELPGIISFVNMLLRIVIAVAGIWVFLNIILAGFGYISAGGDPKKVEQSWTKIWQSLVGLVIILASFIIAAAIGILFFGDVGAILNPTLKP